MPVQYYFFDEGVEFGAGLSADVEYFSVVDHHDYDHCHCDDEEGYADS